jgi:hypothetical protein
MSWKKYFSPVPTSMNQGGSYSPFSFSKGQGLGPAASNYSSHLPDVYVGNPNRVERYGQYNTMDTDSEINAALDILAEFCTQKNKENNTPFKIEYNGAPTNSEVQILSQYLHRWAKLQEFETRMYKIIRNIFKYGDQFFLRDPETKKWFHVDTANLTKIIVNESEGKRPEQYMIKDINISFEGLSATKLNTTNAYGPNGAGGMGGPSMGSGGDAPNSTPGTNNSRFSNESNETAIDAEHVIHMSLSEGMDQNYPFGNSLLESIFKVYKQKELLEDAIIIYRVQRAPERRVFYVDVGNMPSHLAMQFVERVKTEIHQRRIPSKTGGGQTVIDSSYNPLCLDLSTRIPLLDGRTLELTELIAEFEQGKENWAYSCDPITGKVAPGVINWAGITRKNTQTIQLTFDNGETLVCTPDHKIPVFGKGMIEAKDIVETDSLISFNRRNKKISSNSNEYEQVWDHSKKEWQWTHRVVGEFFRNLSKHQEFTYLEQNAGKSKAVIHHQDYNRFNNDPRNLQYMNKADHIQYHAANKSDYWFNLSEEEFQTVTGKISDTLKTRWKNMTGVERQSVLYNIRSAQQKSVWMRQNDPATMSSYKKNAGKSRRNYLNNNPNAMQQVLKNLESRVKIKNQPLCLTFEMLQIVVEIVRTQSTNKNTVINLCDNNKELLDLMKKENSIALDYKNAQCKIDFTRFGYSKLNRLLKKNGYANWKQFVKEIDQFNHKVVKIEAVSNRDTGTITIDGTEKWHNYHTFAIESGIFVKNSINEDYFFPQTAEGRGSKVETLPGGTNLGEIDDLRYFTNKLLRGLRIPSSYLPTGADDSASQFNDGRVGTAYIQELRFNNYCERLQSLVAEVFNKEFKLYLSQKGINIDVAMFDLKLQPPQNFASYRQAELDSNRISTFTSMQAIPFISNRFAMERFLGLSKEEITANETQWREENEDEFETGEQDASAQMRDAGITGADISADMGAADGPESDIDVDDTAGGAGNLGGAPADAQGGDAPFGS